LTGAGIKILLNPIRKVDAKATELLLKEAVSGSNV
jgi:hypothetical protein